MAGTSSGLSETAGEDDLEGDRPFERTLRRLVHDAHSAAGDFAIEDIVPELTGEAVRLGGGGVAFEVWVGHR